MNSSFAFVSPSISLSLFHPHALPHAAGKALPRGVGSGCVAIVARARVVMAAQSSADGAPVATSNGAGSPSANAEPSSDEQPSSADGAETETATVIPSEIRDIPTRPVFYSFLAVGLTATAVLFTVTSAIASYIGGLPLLSDAFRLVRSFSLFFYRLYFFFSSRYNGSCRTSLPDLRTSDNLFFSSFYLFFVEKLTLLSSFFVLKYF